MSAAVEHGPPAGPRILEDVVCTACGCFCDDIELRVEGHRIVEAHNACPIGSRRFLDYRPPDGPACLVDGRPAPIEDGLDHAARILIAARNPLMFGLAEATSETQRAAVSLAARIGATIDGASGESGDPAIDALQSFGEVTATLGEIKNRADLVVVWTADPVRTHPRLFSRYALEPTGTFVPGGRSDRFCVIVDMSETTSVQEAADQFVGITRPGCFGGLVVLRALAAGVGLEPNIVEAATGAPLETWKGLIDRMTAARYGALFYGTPSSGTRPGPAIARAVHALVRDLNTRTRFVCLPLGCAGNLAGARHVLAWQTGYPTTVSLARGFPRDGAVTSGADRILRSGEADAALIVSGQPAKQLSAGALERLRDIPTILLQSEDASIEIGPGVAFRVAAWGIDDPGTVYRMDGVPLPLRAALVPSLPAARDILRGMEDRARVLTEGEWNACR